MVKRVVRRHQTVNLAAIVDAMRGTGRPGHQLTPGAVRKRNLIVDEVVLGAVVPMNNPGHARCKSSPTLSVRMCGKIKGK